MRGLRNLTRWRYLHLDRDGNHLWDSGDWQPNNVTDEGEAWILNVAFRDTELTGLTGFELLLSTAVALTETSVYADRSELADGNGYTAAAVARSTAGWSAPSGTNPTTVGTPATGTTDFDAVGGSWSPVRYACIVTVGLATNRLVAFNALGAERTLEDGHTLKVSFDLQASGT